ncbi:MAG: hypothetical protein ABSB74_10285 [Tepidisphaeraceae bacterium]
MEASGKRPVRLSDFVCAGVCERMSHEVIDGPEIAAVWQRYLSRRDPSDLSILTDHYLPLIKKAARGSSFRRGRVPIDSLADAFADGMLGLLKAIQKTTAYDAEEFRRTAVNRIFNTIWDSLDDRGHGKLNRAQLSRFIFFVRCDLEAKLERPPTIDEMRDGIRSRSKAPAKYLAALGWAENAIEGFSQWRHLADPKMPDPSRRSLNAEVIQLASRGLRGRDKAIFRLTLQGLSKAEIGRRLKCHETNVHYRMCRMFWLMRSDPKLAAYLGVVPDPAPPARPRGRNWPHFVAAPAARLSG